MSVYVIILLRIQYILNSFGGVSERDTVKLLTMREYEVGGGGGGKERERERSVQQMILLLYRTVSKAHVVQL